MIKKFELKFKDITVSNLNTYSYTVFKIIVKIIERVEVLYEVPSLQEEKSENWKRISNHKTSLKTKTESITSSKTSLFSVKNDDYVFCEKTAGELKSLQMALSIECTKHPEIKLIIHILLKPFIESIAMVSFKDLKKLGVEKDTIFSDIMLIFQNEELLMIVESAIDEFNTLFLDENSQKLFLGNLYQRVLGENFNKTKHKSFAYFLASHSFFVLIFAGIRSISREYVYEKKNIFFYLILFEYAQKLLIENEKVDNKPSY